MRLILLEGMPTNIPAMYNPAQGRPHSWATWLACLLLVLYATSLKARFVNPHLPWEGTSFSHHLGGGLLKFYISCCNEFLHWLFYWKHMSKPQFHPNNILYFWVNLHITYLDIKTCIHFKNYRDVLFSLTIKKIRLVKF